MPRRSNVDKAAKPQQAVKRKAGRPEHVPDDRNRRRVVSWAGGGVDQKLIAATLGISDPTLRKHYRAELDTGKAMMDGLAVETLMRAMQAGGRQSVTAAIFWTKMRMGWSKRVRQVGAGGQSNPVVEVVYGWTDAEPVSGVHRAAADAGRL